MNKGKFRRRGMIAAAMSLLIAVCAAAFVLFPGKTLVLESADTGDVYAAYPVRIKDTFGIRFIHSVNKTPVTDWYEIRKDGIYVVRTEYYGFGAGVQTQLEEGQELSYGEDGSMIITGFDRRMDDLVYFVGTVSDHTLTLPGGEQVSLRDLCGKNAKVRIRLDQRRKR